MGIMIEMHDAFSNTANTVGQSMGRVQSQATAMQQAVQNSMNKMQNAFGGLLAGAALASPFVLAVNKAREFEAQLSNIKSLGVLQSDMAKVEELAMKMGAQTKFSAFESAQGIEELLKAGVQLKDVMDKNGLSGALDLAVAGNLKLADAAEIASTALNAFKADGMNIRNAGDILAGAANASATDVMTLKFSLSAVSAVASGVGLSFADTSKALAVFANNGLKGSDAGTSLKTMLMNLQPRSKEQIATFQQLGLVTAEGANAFFDAKGNIKSMADIAGLLNTKLKHLNPQQRAFALETMFGSDAVRAGNILYKEGADGILNMQKEMTKFTAASVAKERLNNFNGAMEMLMGSIDTILIKVGQMFLPTLTRMVQGIGAVADAFLALVSTDIGRYLVMASAAAVGFVVVFGAIIPFIQTTIGVMKVLAMVAWQTALSFAPYLAVAGVVIVLYKAFTSFKEVLEGTAQPAKGLLGFMQRLGAMLWTVGQAISTWDGKSFDLGGMEDKLKSLGIFETVKALSTYVVRFYELGKGIGTGIYEVFAGVFSAISKVVAYIGGAVVYFAKMFGMQNAVLKYSSSAVATWISVGKILGYIIGGLLVTAVVSLTVSLASMAIAVIAATWPILAVITAVGAVIAVFYYWDDIVNWFGKAFNSAMIAIGGFIMNLPAYFMQALNGAYYLLRGWFTNVVPFVSGALLRIGKFIMFDLPYYFLVGFGKAMQWAGNALYTGVPILINAVGTFLNWLVTNVPAWIGNAFTSAVNGAYWVLTDGSMMFIETIWGFLNWVWESVPTMLLSAFQTAFQWIYETLTSFFSELGNVFYSLGETIMNSLWEGLKSVWTYVSNWATESMNSLLSGFNVFGDGEQTPVPSSTPMTPQIGAKISEIEALKQQRLATSVSGTNTEADSNMNFFFDFGEGETIQKVVSKQEALKNARR